MFIHPFSFWLTWFQDFKPESRFSSSYSTKLHYHSFFLSSFQAFPQCGVDSKPSYGKTQLCQLRDAEIQNLFFIGHSYFHPQGSPWQLQWENKIYVPFYHGGFSGYSLSFSTSSYNQWGQGFLVAIPYSKPRGKSRKDLEGKCQISAQPLSILM